MECIVKSFIFFNEENLNKVDEYLKEYSSFELEDLRKDIYRFKEGVIAIISFFYDPMKGVKDDKNNSRRSKGKKIL